MDPRKLTGLPNPGGIVPQRAIVSGYVSTAKPAPTTFTEGIWVILPEHTTERPLGQLPWPALHGITKPAKGARVVVAFDAEDVPHVIYWEGTQSATPWEAGDFKWAARATAGAEWLGPCTGQEASRATYAALFAAIGTEYGEGNKATTFNLPNGKERVLMGAGLSHVLGTSGGEATVELTEAQMPSHTHTDEGHEHEPEAGGEFLKNEVGTGAHFYGTAGEKMKGVLKTAVGKAKLKAAGSGAPHNNLQPFVTGNLFIHI